MNYYSTFSHNLFKDMIIYKNIDSSKDSDYVVIKIPINLL